MTAGRWLTLILGFALAVRVSMLAVSYHSLDLDASFVIQAELARNIVDGNGLSVDTAHVAAILSRWRAESRLVDLEDIPPPSHPQLQPEYFNEPGYGLLQAILWKVTGTNRFLSVRILQVVLDVVMCWLVFWIGGRLGGTGVGLAAAGLYAVFIPGVELVIRPHRDIWVTFAYIASVAMLFKMGDLTSLGRRLVAAAALGVSLAMVAWMRSTIVAYVLVCAVAMFFILPRRHAVTAAGIMLISFAAVLSPLAVRNYHAFGTLMVTRGAVWHSFWGGIGQFENPVGVIEDDAQIARVFGALDSTAVYGTPRYEQVLRGHAEELIAAEPLWYAGTVVKRSLVIVAPKIGRELFFRSPSGSKQTGLLNQTISRTVLMVVDGLFVAGLLTGVWLLRRRWKIMLVAILPLAYTIATLAPFYVVGRNIMNVYFVTLVFASVAFVHVWDRYSTSGGSVALRSTETKSPLPMS